MKNSAPNHALTAGALVLVLLAGCGGGGDSATDTPAPATPTPQAATAAKYVGSWSGCFDRSTTTSRRESVVITQVTAESVSFNYSEVSFAQASCGGSAGTTVSDSGTIAFSGTKVIGTETVDKGSVTSVGSPVQKQVFLVRQGTPATLVFGKNADDGGVLDAEGYPTTLETNGLAKQ